MSERQRRTKSVFCETSLVGRESQQVEFRATKPNGLGMGQGGIVRNEANEEAENGGRRRDGVFCGKDPAECFVLRFEAKLWAKKRRILRGDFSKVPASATKPKLPLGLRADR